MATMTNFLFSQHLKESKNKLENLQKELNKCVDEFNDFLNNIDAENYSDFDNFNNRAKTFNEELNKIVETFYKDKQHPVPDHLGYLFLFLAPILYRYNHPRQQVML